ncbi:MucB/RseB C-terminal domain-containing protein [Endozoicomonas sp. 4G]|uniref:MucB/RseB C-terminal domain-containing protein n=1 Tax=Endozoicomonas sp. 4G TaxID=2872754 RepID=UPI002078AF1A|nr:MucB/RseB C-terminal domain-containing protein [Endozoicomonas sp. 4G]
MKGIRLNRERLLPLLLVLLPALGAHAFPVDPSSKSARQSQELAGQSSKPADTPEKWLETMVQATQNLTYRGHFVYQQGANLETLAVTHTLQKVGDKSEELESIIYLDGSPREMIRQGSKITFASAGKEPARFEHESLVPMVGRFTSGNFGKHYKLKPAALDRIAGREAVQLLVVPTDRFRYGYQLWLDRRTGLLLKSVMVDSEGRIIERMQFTSLEFPGELTSKELARLKRKLPESADKNVVKLNSKSVPEKAEWGWEAGWIPEGFSPRGHSKRSSVVSNQKVDILNFSDGLASFSVFVEPDETRVLSQATEQIGSMAAVSKVFRNGEKYFHATVLGEIPLGAAERIAVSVRPREQSQKADK